MKPEREFILSSPRVRHTEEAAPTAFSREDILAARFKVAKVVPFQHATPPLISNFALALFSGVLLTFAFPEWGLWSLGWVGAAPLVMAVARDRNPWRSLLLGLVTGTVFYAGSSHWVTYSMHNYGGIPLWLSYGLMLLIAVALGAFTALFAAVLALAIRRFGGWGILVAPLVWPATEWLRLKATGVGWNALGYSQAFQPAVVQVARWGGVYAVSFLLVTASAALVFAVIYLERARGFFVLTAAICIGIASVSYGAMLRPEGEPAESLTVAVIQPNVPIDAPWNDQLYVDQVTEAHIDLTEQILVTSLKATNGNSSNEKVALVVWPESPQSFNYERDERLRLRLAGFASRHKVYLLFDGWGTAKAGDDPSSVYNSAMVIAPSGERISRYDKIVLMPFGEYVPARGWIPLMDRVPALVADITPGASHTLSDIAGTKLGTFICFEATRPEVPREFRLRGARLFAQLSNESWFGPTAVARQVLAQAIFRAVENDCELIRATNSGHSARIDRYGSVHEETPAFQTVTRLWKAEIAPGELTFYTRYGDVFVTVCAALSALVVIAALVPKREKE